MPELVSLDLDSLNFLGLPRRMLQRIRPFLASAQQVGLLHHAIGQDSGASMCPPMELQVRPLAAASLIDEHVFRPKFLGPQTNRMETCSI